MEGEYFRTWVVEGEGRDGDRVEVLEILATHLLFDGRSIQDFISHVGRHYDGRCCGWPHGEPRPFPQSPVVEVFDRELELLRGTRLGRRSPTDSTENRVSTVDKRREGMWEPLCALQAAMDTVASMVGSEDSSFGLIMLGPVPPMSLVRAQTYPFSPQYPRTGDVHQLATLRGELSARRDAATLIDGEPLWARAPLEPHEPWHGGPILNLLSWNRSQRFGGCDVRFRVTRSVPVEDVSFLIEVQTDTLVLSVLCNPHALSQVEQESLLATWLDSLRSWNHVVMASRR